MGNSTIYNVLKLVIFSLVSMLVGILLFCTVIYFAFYHPPAYVVPEAVFSMEQLEEDYHYFLDTRIQPIAQQRTAYWQLDYSSLDRFLGSIEPYRDDLAEFISVPSACRTQTQPTLIHEEFIVQIDNVDIFAWEVSVCESQLTSYALVGIPSNIEQSLPTVIAIHGTCGSSERVMGLEFNDYHHQFGLELAKSGYIVIAPLILTRPTINPNCSSPSNQERNEIDKRAMSLGERLIGIEVGKLISLVDYLENRPEINRDQIATYGISLGGTIALFHGALDQRLKVVVVSQYIEDRVIKLVDRIDTNSNWRYPDSDYILWENYLVRYTDVELSLLILPRKLFIEVGVDDPRFATSEEFVYLMQSHYQRLSLPAEFVGIGIGDGGHEIFLSKALEFLQKWL